MIEYDKHEVFIEILEGTNFEPSASVNTFSFPDGSSKATNLTASDLRDIARMCRQAAQDLEELHHD